MVGFNWFYRIVSQNFTRSVNRPALLFILVPLVETEPAENINVVMEPREKNLIPPLLTHVLEYCHTLFQFYYQVLNLGLHKYCCKKITRHCGEQH